MGIEEVRYVATFLAIMCITAGCSNEPGIGVPQGTGEGGAQTTGFKSPPGPAADPTEDSPAGCFERFREATVKGRYEKIYDELAPKSQAKFICTAFLRAELRCRPEAAADLREVASAYGFDSSKAVPRSDSAIEKVAATVKDPRAYLEELSAVIILHDDRSSAAAPTLERYSAARLKDVTVKDDKGIGSVVYTNGITRVRRFERVDAQWRIVVND